MRAYSLWYQIYSSLVQSVERWTVNPYVAGSSPAGGAKFLWFSLFVSFTNPKFVAKEFKPIVGWALFLSNLYWFNELLG